MIHKLLCWLGIHESHNTDDGGIAGEHVCKCCDKVLIEAIKWPRPCYKRKD